MYPINTLLQATKEPMRSHIWSLPRPPLPSPFFLQKFLLQRVNKVTFYSHLNNLALYVHII